MDFGVDFGPLDRRRSEIARSLDSTVVQRILIWLRFPAPGHIAARLRAAHFARKRVLFTRITVSDPLGDARTGIILSNAARTVAAAEACVRAAEAWERGTVLCHSPAAREELTDVERQFAADQPIAGGVLAALRTRFGAEFALLFRPERVKATQDLRQRRQEDIFQQSTNTAIPTSVIRSGTHAQP